MRKVHAYDMASAVAKEIAKQIGVNVLQRLLADNQDQLDRDIPVVERHERFLELLRRFVDDQRIAHLREQHGERPAISIASAVMAFASGSVTPFSEIPEKKRWKASVQLKEAIQFAFGHYITCLLDLPLDMSSRSELPQQVQPSTPRTTYIVLPRALSDAILWGQLLSDVHKTNTFLRGLAQVPPPKRDSIIRQIRESVTKDGRIPEDHEFELMVHLLTSPVKHDDATN